jgi:hypothetical protein
MAARTNTEPTLAILFNEKSGPDQVMDIIQVKHAFVGFETYQTDDEQGRPAFLLLVFCETATADQLFEMIGNRLPDYIQARRFPLSRLNALRAAATG